MQLSYIKSARNPGVLFASTKWFHIIDKQKKLMNQEIDSYHSDKILNTSDNELISYFYQKYAFDFPVIDMENITVNQREKQIDISDNPKYIRHYRNGPQYITGTEIEIEIPFVGDQNFFYIQPSKLSSIPPYGSIDNGVLKISISGIDLEPTRVRSELDSEIEEIQAALKDLKKFADNFNKSIENHCLPRIKARKEKLLRDRNLVAGIGYKIKVRDGVSQTYSTPNVRKKIVPQQPQASTDPYQPEPVLNEYYYNYILDALKSMVITIERSPSALKGANEETIRTLFLTSLNGHFEGRATGETFNFDGKTDILIRDEGKNIFIAECKFWKGEQAHRNTIDQLLGYLSWRDTKAAILIFNRNKNFSATIEKAFKSTLEHQNCKGVIQERDESSRVYSFVHRDDPNRLMTVTLMLFDIPN